MGSCWWIFFKSKYDSGSRLTVVKQTPWFQSSSWNCIIRWYVMINSMWIFCFFFFQYLFWWCYEIYCHESFVVDLFNVVWTQKKDFIFVFVVWVILWVMCQRPNVLINVYIHQCLAALQEYGPPNAVNYYWRLAATSGGDRNRVEDPNIIRSPPPSQ